MLGTWREYPTCCRENQSMQLCVREQAQALTVTVRSTDVGAGIPSSGVRISLCPIPTQQSVFQTLLVALTSALRALSRFKRRIRFTYLAAMSNGRTIRSPVPHGSF
jgi:hypothetical protein